MNHFCLLLIAGLWLLPLFPPAHAQPNTAIVDRLSSRGLLLDKGWRYHSGDDPAWARVDFDDSRWDTLSPTRNRRDLPPTFQTGISWLRLRLHLSDSLRQQALLLRIWQLGAVEVYLNGELVQRQGVVHADPARVVSRATLYEPVRVPATELIEQVVAVRYAPWRLPLFQGVNASPLLGVRLLTEQQFQQQKAEQTTYGTLFYAMGGGWFLLLMLLHLTFFHYNPVQRANYYFAGYALALVLACSGEYCNTTLVYSTLVPHLVVWALTDTLVFLSFICAVRALYALFKFKPGRLYAGLWVSGGVLLVVHVLYQHSPISFLAFLAFLALAIAEQLRLTVRALRQRQRGAWIIGLGFASGLAAVLLLLLLRVLQVELSVLVVNLFLPLVYLPPALSISLYLAREFALDSRLLELKLWEVGQLSAQSLAQEQEKQVLLARQNEMLEQQVQQRTQELQYSITHLRTTQAQLVQSEKMASLGELTAGIAHEIQNPLNFVNNFAEVSAELVAELKEAQAAGDGPEVIALADDLTQNLNKITHHGQRAASIVRGMLEHSRISNGERSPTDLNALCDEYLRLAYHGLRAKDKSFNATLNTRFDAALVPVQVVSQDIGRVLLNLLTNAFYAVQQRQKLGEAGYIPTVSICTRCSGQQAEIRVRDNGTGISKAVQQKIFQPFFTTKPTGEGTGLGLSLSYDIITKGHGGTLSVDTKEGEYTEFALFLPI